MVESMMHSSWFPYRTKARGYTAGAAGLLTYSWLSVAYGWLGTVPIPKAFKPALQLSGALGHPSGFYLSISSGLTIGITQKPPRDFAKGVNYGRNCGPALAQFCSHFSSR